MTDISREGWTFNADEQAWIFESPAAIANVTRQPDNTFTSIVSRHKTIQHVATDGFATLLQAQQDAEQLIQRMEKQ
jgi:hypothetical protein